MNRILSAIAISATAWVTASCCCTSDVKPPKLRPMPQFQEIQAPQPAPEIEATK